MNMNLPFFKKNVPAGLSIVPVVSGMMLLSFYLLNSIGVAIFLFICDSLSRILFKNFFNEIQNRKRQFLTISVNTGTLIAIIGMYVNQAHPGLLYITQLEVYMLMFFNIFCLVLYRISVGKNIFFPVKDGRLCLTLGLTVCLNIILVSALVLFNLYISPTV